MDPQIPPKYAAYFIRCLNATRVEIGGEEVVECVGDCCPGAKLPRVKKKQCHWQSFLLENGNEHKRV